MKDPGNVSTDSTRDVRPELTSPTLVEGVRRGDAVAWGRLARLYGPLVYAWCRRAGLQSADSEDVLQEVFTTVAARIGEFRHGGESDSFRGWLWTITRLEIGDWLRQRSKQPVGASGSEALAKLHETPDLELPEQEAGVPWEALRRNCRETPAHALEELLMFFKSRPGVEVLAWGFPVEPMKE